MNFYDIYAEKYYNKTIKALNSDNLNKFLENISKDGVIVDLGCGSGRDTLYMKSKGYKNILPIDASSGLICEAYKNSGLKILEADIRNYNYALNYYSGIFANASLLHLTNEEFLNVLPKLYRSLKQTGVLYISLKPLKEGIIEETKNGRYFRYYTEKELKDIFYSLDIKNFEIWKTKSTIEEGQDWINILIKKDV